MGTPLCWKSVGEKTRLKEGPSVVPKGPRVLEKSLSLQALFLLVLIVLQNSFLYLTQWQLQLQLLRPKILASPTATPNTSLPSIPYIQSVDKSCQCSPGLGT